MQSALSTKPETKPGLDTQGVVIPEHKAHGNMEFSCPFQSTRLGTSESN
jgi:hypothetical protein